MEEAVSTVEGKLERFSAGERFAVDPDSVERELASLWREAGASSQAKNPVTRACLWNVVVHIEERPRAEGQGTSEALAKMVRDLPQYLAARALVLRTAPEGTPELESWISANCIVAGGGGKLVCSEEVAILARGQGDRHLPALVRALLVPAVPTALVFAGAPPTDRPVIESLIQAADRLVTHADHSMVKEPLRRLREMMSQVSLGVMDLGWLEASSLRAHVASLFDPPATEEEASAIDRALITTTPKTKWTAQLLAAWIASALNAEAPKKVGELAWRFTKAPPRALSAEQVRLRAPDGGPNPSGRPLDVIIQENTSALGLSIELSASSARTTYAVRAIGDSLAEIASPALVTKKPLGKVNPAALLARALATRSEDRAFARALNLAGAM
jgi:glucose-6-phosphate dehydrogenase assembly protein OpcA